MQAVDERKQLARRFGLVADSSQPALGHLFSHRRVGDRLLVPHGVLLQPVSPLFDSPDDSHLFGQPVPPARIQTNRPRIGVRDSPDGRPDWTSGQPRGDLAAPEVTVGQLHETRQRPSHGGLRQRGTARPGYGYSGELHLLGDDLAVVEFAIQDRDSAERRSIPSPIGDPSDHPPDLLVRVWRDEQMSLVVVGRFGTALGFAQG